MNIDQLIREADPAAGQTVPAHDSPIARSSFERMLAVTAARPVRRRLKSAVPVTILAAAAVAAGVTIVLPGVTPGTSAPSAAAAVLNRAAAGAFAGKTLVLGPGQYLYTETRSMSVTTYAMNGQGIYVKEVRTEQVWETAAGVGKTIWTLGSPVTFLGDSRAVWVKEGRPRLGLSPRQVLWMRARHSSAGSNGQVQRAVPLDNLSHLPTNPAALLKLIEHRDTGLSDINTDVDDPSTPGGAFYAAMLLLTQPSTGSSRALRSALFKVMADLPGDKLLGPARTRSGQPGIAIQTPPGMDMFKLIIDPGTGNILEDDEYNRPGDPAEQWTEFLTTAVVGKIGQTTVTKSARQ
jgi:hypothetical protein